MIISEQINLMLFLSKYILPPTLRILIHSLSSLPLLSLVILSSSSLTRYPLYSSSSLLPPHIISSFPSTSITTEVGGNTFDSAEGCGLLSSNKPLDQLRLIFPAAEQELRLEIEQLGHDFMSMFRDVFPEIDCDSYLLFFKAFDPDGTLPARSSRGRINTLTSSLLNTNKNSDKNGDKGVDKDRVPTVEEMRDSEALQDPLKYLGCHMFNKQSKVDHAIAVAAQLLLNYHLERPLPVDPLTPQPELVRLPDRWRKGLRYTICRGFQDINDDINLDNDTLQSTILPHFAKNVSLMIHMCRFKMILFFRVCIPVTFFSFSSFGINFFSSYFFLFIIIFIVGRHIDSGIASEIA